MKKGIEFLACFVHGIVGTGDSDMFTVLLLAQFAYADQAAPQALCESLISGGTAPAANAMDVPLDARIFSLTYPGCAWPGSLTIRGGGQTESVEFDTNQPWRSFVPSQPLLPDTEYTVEFFGFTDTETLQFTTGNQMVIPLEDGTATLSDTVGYVDGIKTSFSADLTLSHTDPQRLAVARVYIGDELYDVRILDAASPTVVSMYWTAETADQACVRVELEDGTGTALEPLDTCAEFELLTYERSAGCNNSGTAASLGWLVLFGGMLRRRRSYSGTAPEKNT